MLIGFLSKNEEDRDTVGDILMSVLFAVLIEVVNTIFVVVISNLTKWERRYTKTGEITIMLYKKCAGFFLNISKASMFPKFLARFMGALKSLTCNKKRKK